MGAAQLPYRGDRSADVIYWGSVSDIPIGAFFRTIVAHLNYCDDFILVHDFIVTNGLPIY